MLGLGPRHPGLDPALRVGCRITARGARKSGRHATPTSQLLQVTREQLLIVDRARAEAKASPQFTGVHEQDADDAAGK